MAEVLRETAPLRLASGTKLAPPPVVRDMLDQERVEPGVISTTPVSASITTWVTPAGAVQVPVTVPLTPAVWGMLTYPVAIEGLYIPMMGAPLVVVEALMLAERV